MDLPSILEPNFETFVPKIRIRLRPNSDEIISNYYNKLSGKLIDKSVYDNDAMAVIKDEHVNENLDTKCYKVLEDFGGGVSLCGVGNDSQIENLNYKDNNTIEKVIKPQSLLLKQDTVPTQLTTLDKHKMSFLTEKEMINKRTVKLICAKTSYKSYILNSKKNHRKKEIETHKLDSKTRNESCDNINLKGIINYENFLKLPSEIQCQLVNLLPDCDKLKYSDNCQCSYIDSIDERPTLSPDLTYHALNNEFLTNALVKHSQKIGQYDSLNLFIADRENLRSRSVSTLNEDLVVHFPTDSEVKVEESLNIAPNTMVSTNDIITVIDYKDEHNDCKSLDDMQSNSSVCTTETIEMYSPRNSLEDNTLKQEQHLNIESISVEQCDKNNVFKASHRSCEDVNGEGFSNDKDLVEHFPYDKVNLSESREDKSRLYFSPTSYHPLDKKYANLTRTLSVDTTNMCHQIKSSELFHDNNRKRGRKRKCFNISDDIVMVPVKRSSRSTAGKRPARLHSESPPTSHTTVPNCDRKPNYTKFKKEKERQRDNRKSKTKLNHSTDDLKNMIKIDVVSKKNSKYQRICPLSPESLPNESDLSPLSKPSPNDSSDMGRFCRSRLVSFINEKKAPRRVNSVKELSPSWSCTSESTTPSVKSDYGHIHSTKVSPSLTHNNLGYNELKNSPESDTKLIHGMPPPRQTLTLAAMREKMRAKKLAKEDNRRECSSPDKKSYKVNNSKCKCPNDDYDDASQIMDKYMNNSEEIDELLYNSQDSLLDFFMGEDNYDIDGTIDSPGDISTYDQKPLNVKKSMSKNKSFTGEAFNQSDILKNPVKRRRQSNKENSNISHVDSNSESSISNKTIVSRAADADQTQSHKSIADNLATVLQKLNSSKENGLVTTNIVSKTPTPNAYLVDGNGLSSALSIIQSLNPSAKVTTQQFYLVNSGAQLILQQSPPTSIQAEKITSVSSSTSYLSVPPSILTLSSTSTPIIASSSLSIPNKVSLALKVLTQPSLVRQQSKILSNPLSSINDGLHPLTFNHLTFANSNNTDKPINLSSDSLPLFQTPCLKIPMNSECQNTFMMSPITHNVPINSCSNALQLQTISTPHPIGLVHSVQPSSSLSPVFQSQLRFLHPTLTNQSTHNTISLIGSNLSSINTAIPNSNNTNPCQSPKVLFLCPTVGSQPQPSLINNNTNVVNQEQKYLLLSKQPDKQATIQVVSSQGLWQQLNPTMISQSNKVLLMQSPSLSSLDSTNLHSVTATKPVQSSIYQNAQYIVPNLESSSSLIVDSRSIMSQLPNDDPIVTSTLINRVVEDSKLSKLQDSKQCQDISQL